MTETLCIPADQSDKVIGLIEESEHVELISVENYIRELMGVVYVTVSFDRAYRLYDLAMIIKQNT